MRRLWSSVRYGRQFSAICCGHLYLTRARTMTDCPRCGGAFREATLQDILDAVGPVAA